MLAVLARRPWTLRGNMAPIGNAYTCLFQRVLICASHPSET
jgi:hypothetical protein